MRLRNNQCYPIYLALLLWTGHCAALNETAPQNQDSFLHGVKGVLLQFLAPPPSLPAWIGSSQWLKIVTGGDQTAVASAANVIDNQRAFAAKHGYAYEVHSGNYAHPWIAYWHKIDVLLRELRAPNPAKVLAWFDLDLVVTNPSLKMLEGILAAHPSSEVILTEDSHRGSEIPGMEHAKRLVNTGVILVRSGPEAERVLEKLLEYGRQNRNAAYLPQDTNTLHEQDAFNSLLSGPRRHVWRRHIAVIPQRSGSLNLNTFARNLYDPHFEDPVHAEWTAGDFTSHCTGLRKQFREWCIADGIEASAVALAAASVCTNGTFHKHVPSSKLVLEEGEQALSFEAILQKGNDLLQGSANGWFKPRWLSV